MKKIIVLVLLCGVLLGGCYPIDAEIPGHPRVVTGITAAYESGAVTLRRSYTDSEKMQAVLTWLRCLKPYGSAEAVTEADSSATVTLHYSDSTEKVYELLAGQYLRVNGGAWQNLNPDQGQELPLLLGMLESD